MTRIRRLLAGTVIGVALAGCAALAPPAPPAADGVAAAPARPAPGPTALDLASKFTAPRIKGKRARAEMNAKYHLQTEADEWGPPSAAQIFRAHADREALLREAAAAPLAKTAGIQPWRWQALGPSNVAGRVRAIAFDPRNARRMLVGTASGGLWHSEDGGVTWRANHDFLPNLSVSTVAFDPANPSVVYLGTGEESAGLVGVGAFKSVDGGNTWRPMPATSFDANPEWRFVNRLAVHPRNPAVVLAGLTHENRQGGAIYRSADHGATWVRVAALKALDLAFDPNNPDNAVAGLDDGALAYSRDAGLTWTRTATLVPRPSGRLGTARAEIAFARGRSGLVYASVDHDGGEIWRSPDSGITWERVSVPKHIGPQGDYNNAIWVDPLDPFHLIAGGLDLHQSFDGGLSFLRVSNWNFAPVSPHADHHALVSPPDYGPGNPVLYSGNDGGIYRATDVRAVTATGDGWRNMNEGLAVTQFYSGAGRAAAGGRVIGGTQDNGSLLLSSGWRTWFGGDGGYVAVDPGSDATIYGSTQFLGVVRSLAGGVGARFICAGITEAYKPEGNFKPCGEGTTGEANFIAPMIMDPNAPTRLLAGANSLWVTDDARAMAPAWRAIMPPSPTAENYINAIAVHEGDANRIWVGRNNGEVHRTTTGLAAQPAWQRVGAGLPERRVMRIMVDRDEPARVIVAFTGFTAHNLWETRDHGATWRSITGNLPRAPIFDVKRHAHNPAWLYVATSVGVFASENGGATWSTTNEGPANIRVRELFWIDDTTLGAATYGRGMFSTPVAAGGPANYQDLWWAGPQENGWGMSLTQHGAMIFGALYLYDAQGRPTWLVLPGGGWNAGFTAFSGPLYQPTGAWFGAYDASRFVVGAPVGHATLAFTSLTTATLTYTIHGVSGTKTIQRQFFGPQDSTPVATYGDLWWGGTSQNGWGVAINQQYRTLFCVWYTYGADGRTAWYVVPGGTWTAANVFTGTAYRTSGSPWLGAAYDASMFRTQPVGQVTFTFTDLHNAVMSYTIDGVPGSKAITRQPF